IPAAWTTPSYSRLESVVIEAQLCLKCHSTYGWDTDPADATDPNTTDYDQTDIGKEFNPNNKAHHPIFATGKNQPSADLNRVNWEGEYRISTGTWQRTGPDGTIITGTVDDDEYVGLDNTFVPPFKATSIITCSDCHDNSVLNAARGPHGSAYKWLLKGLDSTIKYYEGENVLYEYSAYSWDAIDASNFCLNCHRVEAYGSDGTAPDSVNLSRFYHDLGQPCGQSKQGAYNVYDNGCLNCHGGDASVGTSGTNVLGGIHGSNAGQGTFGISEVGPRFLNGACWDGTAVGDTSNPGTCYTKGASDQVNTCGSHDASTSKADFLYNYDY
ncbi:MAG: hypothetical protein KAS39_00060, partial [Actinomycetia bacterium]|nr:hypothetical protein [Actinomycetes bacterium]